MNYTLDNNEVVSATPTFFGANPATLKDGPKKGERTLPEAEDHARALFKALTDEQRATGLMHRRELPEGRGMLFDFGRDQEIAMWMKNTYISLDMIFITRDGRIHRIAENTEPLSERIIPSGGPVRGVLEVIGGTARKFGIAPGDRVAHPLFSGR